MTLSRSVVVRDLGWVEGMNFRREFFEVMEMSHVLIVIMSWVYIVFKMHHVYFKGVYFIYGNYISLKLTF